MCFSYPSTSPFILCFICRSLTFEFLIFIVHVHCKNIRRFLRYNNWQPSASPFPVVFTGARKHFQESGTER